MSEQIAAEPRPGQATRLVLGVSVAVGFSIMGDSLLYGILPLAAPVLGIPLPLVGVLLSANRLVRLLSNTWSGHVFERFGPHRPFLLATAMGLGTALLYGVGRGFLVFLLARLLWGVAWSGLRQGVFQAIWTGDPDRAGRLMGLSWGVIRLGSAVSVVVGGFLWDRYGFVPAVMAIAGFTALAIPLALLLPWPVRVAQEVARATAPGTGSVWQGWRSAVTQALPRWVLLAGLTKFVFNSVLVATASLFLASRLGSENGLAVLGLGIGAVAGLVLALRWLADLAVGPLLGGVSDRLGRNRTALLLVAGMLGGLVAAVTLSGPASLAWFSLVLILNAGLNVVLDAMASQVALSTERPHLYVGAYATASDAGAALGPLLAYSLGSVASMSLLYLVVAGLLAGITLGIARLNQAG